MEMNTDSNNRLKTIVVVLSVVDPFRKRRLFLDSPYRIVGGIDELI